MRRDHSIDTLLDLDGEILAQDYGYWVKIEAHLVTPTKERPHGIKYSLTLHDKYGDRVLGYDNAHAVRPIKSRRYGGHVIEYDHTHDGPKDTGKVYRFDDAATLMADFFKDVDRIMREVKNR